MGKGSVFQKKSIGLILSPFILEIFIFDYNFVFQSSFIYQATNLLP